MKDFSEITESKTIYSFSHTGEQFYRSCIVTPQVLVIKESKAGHGAYETIRLNTDDLLYGAMTGHSQTAAHH